MKTHRTLRPTLLQRLRALWDQALHRLWYWSQRSTTNTRAPVLVPVRVRDERHLPHHPQRQRQRYRPTATNHHHRNHPHLEKPPHAQLPRNSPQAAARTLRCC